MRLRPVAPIVALTLLCAGIALQARTQGTLESAVALYAAAAYDEALAMIDRLPAEGLDPAARVSVDHYRMLCLLALGRTDDAERVAASLLEVHPTYRISDNDTSPRVLKVFLDARRRALPGVVRQRYEQARKLYADRDYAGAATDFAVVRTLLADSDLTATDARLANLGQLAADFEDLSRAAIATAEARAIEARAAAESAEKAREAERAEAARAAAAAPPVPAPPPEPVDGIYGAEDRGVVPPVAIRQELRRWPGPMPPPMAGTPLGEVRFVVDETGAVIDAAVVESISGFYDMVVMESVKMWRYQPATKAGRPVKFRRVVALLSR